MRQKDLIEISITAVLVIVMVFMLGNAMNRNRLRNIKNIKPKITDSVATPVVQEAKANSKNLYNWLEEQAKSFELKRDPFTAAPIASDDSVRSGTVLSGILWDKDKPMAIIDGNIVSVGQRFGRQTVMDIKRDRVVLSDGENLVEIKLQK